LLKILSPAQKPATQAPGGQIFACADSSPDSPQDRSPTGRCLSPIPDNLHDVIAGSAPVIVRGPKDGTAASSGHSSMLTARSAVWQVTNNLVLFLFLAGRMIKDDEPNPSLSSM
jgi:hypothetical protein